MFGIRNIAREAGCARHPAFGDGLRQGALAQSSERAVNLTGAEFTKPEPERPDRFDRKIGINSRCLSFQPSGTRDWKVP
jgi:hypothetical protein